MDLDSLINDEEDAESELLPAEELSRPSTPDPPAPRSKLYQDADLAAGGAQRRFTGIDPPLSDIRGSRAAGITSPPPFQPDFSIASGSGLPDSSFSGGLWTASVPGRRHAESLSERLGSLSLPTWTGTTAGLGEPAGSPSLYTSMDLPSSSRNVAGLGQIVPLASPAGSDTESGDICAVCESTNGPWRRGPLGLRCLCNSCGHIPGSSTEARTYSEAIELLDALRLQRLQRVRRRQGNDTASLLARLQQLPERSKRMAMRKFSEANEVLTRTSGNTSPKSFPPRPTTRLPPTTRDRSLTTTAAMFPSLGSARYLELFAPQTAMPIASAPLSRSTDAVSTIYPHQAVSGRSGLSYLHPGDLAVGVRAEHRSGTSLGRGTPGHPGSLRPGFVSGNVYDPSRLPALPSLPPLQSLHSSQLRNTSPSSYALGSYRQADPGPAYPARTPFEPHTGEGPASRRRTGSFSSDRP